MSDFRTRLGLDDGLRASDFREALGCLKHLRGLSVGFDVYVDGCSPKRRVCHIVEQCLRRAAGVALPHVLERDVAITKAIKLCIKCE